MTHPSEGEINAYNESKKREPLEKAEIQVLKIAKVLKELTPVGWCFTLILASKGKNGYSTYISDIERNSVIEMLKSTIKSMEERKEI